MSGKVEKTAVQNNAVKKRKRNLNNVGYLFVLPFIVVFCIFSVYPVIRTFIFSFNHYKGYGEMTFAGLDNYIRVFEDKFFWQSIVNTLRLWGVGIVVQMLIAFLLVLIFSDMKYKFKGLGVFRALFYLPNLIAATSIAFLFKTLLDWRFGSINQAIMATGLITEPINWLGDPNIAPVTIGLITAWMWFGNTFIVLMAGVGGISKDYYEAALIDGAGRFRTFFSITIPLLKPILLYISITSFIGGLQTFDIPYLISGGTTGNPSGVLQTATMYLYKFGFETRQMGYAAAIAYVMFMIILVVSVIQFKVVQKED